MSSVDDPPLMEARTVRPYTMTGGRTRAMGLDLPLEALVQSITPAPEAATVALERRRIIDLCTDIMSVAEVSAHLHLPLGVVRVLIGDLATAGLVRVHNTAVPTAPLAHLKVLESVLNGISQL